MCTGEEKTAEAKESLVEKGSEVQGKSSEIADAATAVIDNAKESALSAAADASVPGSLSHAQRSSFKGLFLAVVDAPKIDAASADSVKGAVTSATSLPPLAAQAANEKVLAAAGDLKTGAARASQSTTLKPEPATAQKSKGGPITALRALWNRVFKSTPDRPNARSRSAGDLSTTATLPSRATTVSTVAPAATSDVAKES